MAADISFRLTRFLVPTGIDPGTPVLVGVSGGLDSMVLLHALKARGQAIVVVHVDHGLRGDDSTADAEFVRQHAGDSGFVLVRVDVAARAAAANQSLESAGRIARREAFGKTASQRGITHLMLAHHADDQAETLLWNLARGCGLAGAGGMAPAECQEFPESINLTILRPLLDVRRSDLLEYAKAHELAWREDASNQDTAFTRNRIRHSAIPALEASTGRDAVVSLNRFCSIAREDNAYLESLAADALTNILRDGNSLDVPLLRALPLALRRRVILLWLGPFPAPSFEDIMRILAIAQSTTQPSKINISGNRHVARRAKRLHLLP